MPTTDFPTGDERAATVERLRRMLPADAAEQARDGRCPICGKQFRALAIHVPRKHAVPIRVLRDALGLTWSEPLIAPDLRERKIAQGRERATPQQLAAMRAGYASAAETTAVSPAGRIGRGGTSRARKAASDGERDAVLGAFGGALGDELLTVQRDVRRAQAVVASLLLRRHLLIVEAVRQGAAPAALARFMGVSAQTVHNVLDEAAVKPMKGSARLGVEDRRILERFAAGEPLEAIGRDFGITRQAVLSRMQKLPAQLRQARQQRARKMTKRPQPRV